MPVVSAGGSHGYPTRSLKTLGPRLRESVVPTPWKIHLKRTHIIAELHTSDSAPYHDAESNQTVRARTHGPGRTETVVVGAVARRNVPVTRSQAHVRPGRITGRLRVSTLGAS